MNEQIHPHDERQLSRKELAARWNLSVKTIKRKEKAGELQPLTLGPRTVRHRLSDILAYEADAISTK